MRELEYRIAHFDECCGRLKGKKIFLYGTGANAGTLIDACDAAYGFSAVITNQEQQGNAKEEAFFCGKPVLTMEEAVAQKPDVILIAAQMYAAETVYQRIRKICAENGIRIFDMYGYDQEALHEELEAQPFLDLAGWRKRTEGYDVISFELLDTLIERDLFHNRPARVRAVFRKLIPQWREKGVRLIFVADPEQEKEWYREVLVREGLLSSEEEQNGCLVFREDREAFFRELKAKVPGRKYLHIGHSVFENGVIPRLCGFNVCRLIYYDMGKLTAFRRQRGSEAWSEGVREDRILEAAEKAEAVSFDIFDTLLVRRTLEFKDIFALTAVRALEAGIFTSVRECLAYTAERENVQSAEETHAQMFERLGRILRLSGQNKKWLAKTELEIEESVLVPRKSVAGFLQKIRNLGCRVVLTSDMYLTKDQLSGLLSRKGITGYEKIFVSCDYRLSKKDGLLICVSEELSVPPEKILHIGDSIKYDEIPAGRARIPYQKIPSAKEMAESAGIMPADPEDEQDFFGRIAAHLLSGMWIARRFNDPFQKKEKERKELLYEYGQTAMAPVIAGFLFRLLSEAGKGTGDHPAALLFAARDGYLLKELYGSLKRKEMPEAVYFYTSRRAAFLLSADRTEAAWYVRDQAKGMKAEEILGRFFGIPAKEQKIREKSGSSEEEFYRTLLAENEAAIRQKVRAVKKGYERYCDSCGLTAGQEYFYIDFVASGTTQRLLEEVSAFRLKGRYFGHPPFAGKKECDAEVYMDGDSEDQQTFLARYMEMEYYMTSPEASLREYDEDGTPMFDPEIRSEKELGEIGIVHEGIRVFFRTFQTLLRWEFLNRDPEKTGDGTALYKALKRAASPDTVCRMYRLSADSRTGQRFFDDWSGKWI